MFISHKKQHFTLFFNKLFCYIIVFSLVDKRRVFPILIINSSDCQQQNYFSRVSSPQTIEAHDFQWPEHTIKISDHRGHDRMVAGFTTTCPISVYHH